MGLGDRHTLTPCSFIYRAWVSGFLSCIYLDEGGLMMVIWGRRVEEDFYEEYKHQIRGGRPGAGRGGRVYVGRVGGGGGGGGAAGADVAADADAGEADVQDDGVREQFETTGAG